MLDEGEQRALDEIKRYLDAGYSIDDIDEAGWADWLDHFEEKGIDVQTGEPGEPGLQGPSDAPPPRPVPPQASPSTQVNGSGNPFASGFFGCLGVGAAIIVVIIVLTFIGAFAAGSCDPDTSAILLL